MSGAVKSSGVGCLTLGNTGVMIVLLVVAVASVLMYYWFADDSQRETAEQLVVLQETVQDSADLSSQEKDAANRLLNSTIERLRYNQLDGRAYEQLLAHYNTSALPLYLLLSPVVQNNHLDDSDLRLLEKDNVRKQIGRALWGVANQRIQDATADALLQITGDHCLQQGKSQHRQRFSDSRLLRLADDLAAFADDADVPNRNMHYDLAADLRRVFEVE